MRVTVLGPNLNDQSKGTFVVHAEGCADLSRGVNRMEWVPHWSGDYPSRTAVCDDVYVPEEFQCTSGEYLSEFHFMPCLAHFPQEDS